jgi:sugar lactone lactonase YvrE
MAELEVLLDGLCFPEGPRWHQGRLWFSDFYAHEVVAVDLDGKRETIVEVPNQPSGLGWLPDGRLLVVSMLDRRLMRLDPDGLHVAADLSAHATSHCNDMVVDREGRAYVGNFGFDRRAGEPPREANLVRADPDGRVSVAAAGLRFPNGSAITPDDRTLIVAESGGQRLTAWDRHGDGSLFGRRLFADLAPAVPDGICLDAEGAIWCADPRNREVIRVLEGGQVTHRLSTGDHGAYACMLGGADGRTLLVCTARASGPEGAGSRSGRIELTRVEVPGAGLP